MRLLLDQGTPWRAAALLRQAGWDVVHTREVGLADADDAVILDRAAEDGRTVVTLDSDFHQLLALSGDRKPSVIRVRIEGLVYDTFAALLQKALPARASEIEAGTAISITPRGVRVRRLPLPTISKS